VRGDLNPGMGISRQDIRHDVPDTLCQRVCGLFCSPDLLLQRYPA